MTAAEPRWYTRSDWSTSHLIRPGITRNQAGDDQAGVTLCGRVIAHFCPAAYSTERCGQCSRRLPVPTDTPNDDRRNP